ncbi:MAG TPA: neutral zinc metallopeptidase [Solirubrobacteraceae bacterium]|nr:neutral zinc metallopeptidase [Solirubrobacteraceae bacterium]
MRRAARSRLLLLPILAFALVLPGCGSEDLDEQVAKVRTQAEQLRDDVQKRIDRAEQEFEERRARYGDRIDEVLADLEKVFERPEQTSPKVRSRGNNEPQTIDAFLTDVLGSVDGFWTKTFATSDLPEPRVSYNWIRPGGRSLTACGEVAGDDAAFYCPADDTIYIAQSFAARLYEGVLQGLPGEGRARGDFAVAYVVAHEYAHNLQTELGIFSSLQSDTAKPFELQADCLAGVWAYSVFAEGAITSEDIEEAAQAALAVGDFDVNAQQHHGTPQERRAALLTGFETGRPTSCDQYLT